MSEQPPDLAAMVDAYQAAKHEAEAAEEALLDARHAWRQDPNDANRAAYDAACVRAVEACDALLAVVRPG
jgi:hypothetical protein